MDKELVYELINDATRKTNDDGSPRITMKKLQETFLIESLGIFGDVEKYQELLSHLETLFYERRVDYTSDEDGVAWFVCPPTLAMEDFARTDADGRALGLNFMVMAERLVRSQPMYFDDAGIWWIWVAGKKRWVRGDVVDVRNAIHELTKWDGIVSQKNRNELIAALEMVARKNKPADPMPTWIQFADCVVDYVAGKTFAASPKYMFANPLPWKYGEGDTKTIEKYICDWIPDETERRQFWEILAYVMLPAMPLHRLFWFEGGGRNGKGTAIKMICRFVGHENCAATDVDRITSSRFESANLWKKLVATVSETDFAEISNTNRLKGLIGDEPLAGEIKRAGTFMFTNYAKIIIGTNTIPASQDTSVGWKAKPLIISFPREFEIEQDVLSMIHDSEFHALGRKLIGILRELIERGKFYGEGTISERAARYEAKSNPMKVFLREFCDVGPTFEMSKWQFRDAFREFLARAGHRDMTEERIGMAVKAEGIEKTQKTVGYDEAGRPIRWWMYSLRLKEAPKTSQIHSFLIATAQAAQATQVSTLSLSRIENQVGKGVLLVQLVQEKVIASLSSFPAKEASVDAVLATFPEADRPAADAAIAAMLDEGLLFEIRPGVVRKI